MTEPFLDFLKKNEISEKPKLCRFLKAFYSEHYPNGKITKSTRSKRELLRAAFGKTQADAENFIKLAKEEFEKSTSSKLNLETGSYAVFGEMNGASSKYNSLEVMIDGERWFITNTDKNNGSVLNDKRLAPKNIGINLSASYDDFEKLASDIDLTGIDPSICSYIGHLIDSVRELGASEKTGCFSLSSSTVTDCFSYGSEDESNFNGKLVLKLVPDIERINPEDRKIVSKDFGEVLGPLIFLRMFGDAFVQYSESSKPAIVFSESINKALIDYYVNHWKVSSKSMKASSPSGASSFECAFREAELNPGLFSDEEKAFIHKIKSIYDEKSMFLHQKAIIQNWLFPNFPSIEDFLEKEISFSCLKNEKELSEKLSSLADKAVFFQSLYDALKSSAGYFYKYSSKLSPDNIGKNFQLYSDKLRWGIVFYPLYAAAVRSLSSEENNKLLSSVMRKVMKKLKQCYLYVFDDKIEFSMYSAEKSDWKFISKGPSTGQIANSRLKISMVK